jgi:hypothetical protein
VPFIDQLLGTAVHTKYEPNRSADGHASIAAFFHERLDA